MALTANKRLVRPFHLYICSCAITVVQNPGNQIVELGTCNPVLSAWAAVCNAHPLCDNYHMFQSIAGCVGREKVVL